ncbi:MAG: hypothetical protein V3T24_07860, partial [Longimicrobiales bacterium]
VDMTEELVTSLSDKLILRHSFLLWSSMGSGASSALCILQPWKIRQHRVGANRLAVSNAPYPGDQGRPAGSWWAL